MANKTNKDIKTEFYKLHRHRNGKTTIVPGIKATHIPTGIYANCTEFDNEIENKKQAIENLKEELFKHRNTFILPEDVHIYVEKIDDILHIDTDEEEIQLNEEQALKLANFILERFGENNE